MPFPNFLKSTGTTLALALALLATPACSQIVPPSTEVTSAEVRPDGAEPGPALWELHDEDTTIYLFGTVHVLPAGIDWYDQRIAAAFTSSDEFVTEVDMRDNTAMSAAIAGSAMLGPDQNLRDMMQVDDRQQYEDTLATLGLPPAALDQFEPWFAAMNLSVLPLLQAGYDADSGVEMALQSRAQGKERAALETIQEQVDLFDQMDPAYQLTYLDSTVESVPTVVPMVNEMVAEWLEGDADRLAEIMNGELDDGYLYDRLLVNRNAHWVDWIAHRLEQPGTVFIAVGAGHLAGEGSVQKQLVARGFTVTRVWQ